MTQLNNNSSASATALTGEDDAVLAREQRLCDRVSEGRLYEALAELSATDWSDPSRFALALRDAVAEQLVAAIRVLYDEMVPRTLAALNIMPITCQDIIVDYDGVMHLVRDREHDGAELADYLDTACGQRLESPFEAQLFPAPRGAWSEPGPHEVSRCPGCAEQASDFPETAEPADTYKLAAKLAHSINESMEGQQRPQVAEAIPELSQKDVDDIAEDVATMYETDLIADLTARFRAGGEDAVRAILGRYYERAQRDLERVGHPGPPGALLTEDDYRRIVTHAVIDSAEEDGEAVAATYSYMELRTTIGKRIRALRGS